MQINRLFEIVYILLDKKNITANELAEHFEVSKRTILRDIETLTIAGIPIYTTKGKGGGISILDNFVLNKTAVSEEEQNQILIALQSLASTQHMDTDGIISRLGALFRKTDTSWIEVDFSRWGSTNPDKEKFEMIKRAVINKLPLSFSYPGSNGELTSRTVYPLKLVFKSSAGMFRRTACPGRITEPLKQQDALIRRCCRKALRGWNSRRLPLFQMISGRIPLYLFGCFLRRRWPIGFMTSLTREQFTQMKTEPLP